MFIYLKVLPITLSFPYLAYMVVIMAELPNKINEDILKKIDLDILSDNPTTSHYRRNYAPL